MSDPAGHVVELIFGRWRSQILYAGAALGVFDRLSAERATTAAELARALPADGALLYRLLRALASIGLLREQEGQAFMLTASGALLRADDPRSLRAMALLEEGPEHYAIWKHLPAMVRDGRQNAFVREFGAMAFDHARADKGYGDVFNQAMTSYSALQSQWAQEALAGFDFAEVATLCDVAGGHGHLMCAFLQAHAHLKGIVFDLPSVVGDRDRLWAPRLGLADRCAYVGGDMFKAVPAADAYTLKLILHDWNDDECVVILSNLRRSVIGKGHVFIVEHVVSGPDQPHFAKLFDIHMMCWGTGRERTEAEYASLLAKAGWTPAGCRYPSHRTMGVVVGAA